MPTLRITAGTLRGRRVLVPERDVRPTSERARQAYFNIVADRIDAAHFLDLFAGSGIFSFEALSRGAASATAIEQSRRNCEAIARSAAAFGVEVETISADVLHGMKRLARPVFDLVYADPPYSYDRYADLLMSIGRHVPLAPEAIVALEHRRNTELPAAADDAPLAFTRRAEYGEVWISFFAPSK